jgi:regulator of RNase E activity RraA
MTSSLNKHSRNSTGLIQRLAALNSSVIADALDHVGIRSNCMSASLTPILPDALLAGRAVTLQTVPVAEPPPDGFEREMRALDELKPGDVVVADARAVECAFWGELLSNAAQAMGASGAVIDGWIRDIKLTQAINFPVYARGASPYDSTGRLNLSSVNTPVYCGGVLVRPGDFIIGDRDGISVVPAVKITEVLVFAESKTKQEDVVRKLYASGKKPSEVFKEHRVL